MGYKPNFATETENLEVNSRIYVNSLNAFPEPVGGVITLTNGIKYIFTKQFSFGSNQLKVPDVGQVEFQGTSELVEPILTAVANGTPFIIGDVQRLVSREVDFLNVTGTGKFMEVATINSPSPTIVMRRMLVIGFADIGSLEGVFSIMDNVVFVNCQTGLVMSNPNSKRAALLWEDVSYINQGGARYLSISDKMLYISSVNTVAEPATGQSLFYLNPNLEILTPSGQVGNGTAYIIDSGFTNKNGGDFLDSAGLDQTDSRFVFSNNSGTIDSNTLGSVGFINNSTETVISNINDFFVINGTYVAGDEERFLVMGNQIICKSISPVKVSLAFSVSLQLKENIETDVIEISPHINGSEIVSSRISQQMPATFQGKDQVTRSTPFVSVDNVYMELGDALDLRVRNTSNPTNIIATDLKLAVNK